MACLLGRLVLSSAKLFGNPQLARAERLRDHLWRQFGGPIAEPLGKQLQVQLQNRLQVEFWSSGPRLTDQFRDYLADQIWQPLGHQLWGQIYRLMHAQLWEQLH